MFRHTRLFVLGFAAIIAAFMLAGCAMTPRLAGAPQTHPDGGLTLSLRDQSTATFPDNDWTLTMRGVHGNARMHGSDGMEFAKDTTISYLDVISASASRGTTVKQFFLTVLGIILVIGLAAIILYAAFLATDR